MRSLARFALVLFSLCATAGLAQFDHSHKAWDALLKKHVKYVQNGNASQVDYAGFSRDRTALKAALEAYSAVPRSQFDGWSKPQQQAFLTNAYNAFTIEKILTRYPNIKSIREFGTIFGNPWKDKFFTLFGQPAYLDQIEHEMLRKEGSYDDPRVHVAVVCASIGCPMLRDEAFAPEKVEAQMEDGMRRFLSDRTRNRYNPQARRLEISRIFDWYGKDFEKGHKGYSSVKGTMSRYADLLADSPEDRNAVRSQGAEVTFLEYDWALNDPGQTPNSGR